MFGPSLSPSLKRAAFLGQLSSHYPPTAVSFLPRGKRFTDGRRSSRGRRKKKQHNSAVLSSLLFCPVSSLPRPRPRSTVPALPSCVPYKDSSAAGEQQRAASALRCAWPWRCEDGPGEIGRARKRALGQRETGVAITWPIALASAAARGRSPPARRRDQKCGSEVAASSAPPEPLRLK